MKLWQLRWTTGLALTATGAYNLGHKLQGSHCYIDYIALHGLVTFSWCASGWWLHHDWRRAFSLFPSSSSNSLALSTVYFNSYLLTQLQHLSEYPPFNSWTASLLRVAEVQFSSVQFSHLWERTSNWTWTWEEIWCRTGTSSTRSSPQFKQVRTLTTKTSSHKCARVAVDTIGRALGSSIALSYYWTWRTSKLHQSLPTGTNSFLSCAATSSSTLIKPSL